MNTTRLCPFCRKEADYRRDPNGETSEEYSCPRCGTFSISELVIQDIAEQEIRGGSAEKHGPHHEISGAIRNLSERGGNTPVTITRENLQDLLDEVDMPENSPDQIDLLLEHVARKGESTGGYVELTPATDYPLIFAKGQDEFRHCFEKAQEMYLESDPTKDQSGHRLNEKGRERLREIRENKA